MDTAALEPNQVGVWWLGQSGYLLKWRGRLLGIDLYLSEHLTAKYAGTPKPHIRMTRAPIRGGDLRGLSLVLATHQHSDHLDPGTLPDLLRASPDCLLVLPRPLESYAVHTLGLPADRLMPVDVGDSLDLQGVRVHPIPSAHEDLDLTPEGRHPYLGYLIRFGEDLTVYHSGDTIPHPALFEALRGFRVDVAFLPINGRDSRRHALGVPGNMTIHEACRAAQEVAAALIIPHHYDMFTFNTADVREFSQEMERCCPEIRTRILRCGEPAILSR